MFYSKQKYFSLYMWPNGHFTYLLVSLSLSLSFTHSTILAKTLPYSLMLGTSLALSLSPSVPITDLLQLCFLLFTNTWKHFDTLLDFLDSLQHTSTWTIYLPCVCFLLSPSPKDNSSYSSKVINSPGPNFSDQAIFQVTSVDVFSDTMGVFCFGSNRLPL